jgi:CRP-like cAMP-binding protein
MKDNKKKEFEAFYKKFQTRFYKKGEMLIRADDDPQGIFCLKKGYVRQYTISKTGNELTLHILKPISYFPMVWAVNGTPNVYYFEALSPVEVGRAPRDEVVNFISDKPVIVFELLSELIEDYAESLKRIEQLVFSDAYRRVIAVLLYIAKHFGTVKGKNTIVDHRFTQQDIATLVGVARETASNEIVKLEKKGLIKYVDHSMIFEDLKQLDKELTSINSKS